MSDVKPELVERMMAHLRKCAAETVGRPNDLHREMLAIVAELPPAPEPVDPLLVEAREILAARAATTEGAQGWRTGKWDGEHEMLCTLAALRRGMELQREAAPLTREIFDRAAEAAWRDNRCEWGTGYDTALFDRLHAALTEGQSK